MSTAPRIDAYVEDAIAEADEVEAQFVPDFADVLARAAKLRPIDAPELERRMTCARELDLLDDEALERAARIGDLDRLIESAREHAETQSATIPVVPLRPRARVRWLAIGGVVAACAAALVLLMGLRAQRLTSSSEIDYSGASRIATPEDRSQTATHREPAPRPRVRATTPAVVPPPPATAIVEPVPPPRSKPARVSLRERLAELDRDARSAWQRGDLEAAESALEQLVRSGGRSTLADLAWGDLFELARQTGDARREAKLWQRYLQVLPRGRHSDDARAGLCRRAKGEDAIACWRRYLADRPNGTWREQATRAIAAGQRP
jgi:hypothetical protein